MSPVDIIFLVLEILFPMLGISACVVLARATPIREVERTQFLLSAAERHADALQKAYRGEIEGGKPLLQAWTPAEREAFGINDTDRFIAETDRTLKEIERERIKLASPAVVAGWRTPDQQPEVSLRAWGQPEVSLRAWGHVLPIKDSLDEFWTKR